MSRGIDRLMPDPGARRVMTEEVVALPVLQGPDGPLSESTAAVRADVAQDAVNARDAERAFITADARFK